MYYLGACLLWSAVIMILFKYQQCGPDYPVEDHKNEQKKPLVNHDDIKSSINDIKDGDRIIV